MFFVYLGKNGSGKTNRLNEIYDGEKKEKIFFPCASEILTMINGSQNQNFQGMFGQTNKKYDNPILILIKIILQKVGIDKKDEKKLKKTIELIENSKVLIDNSLKNILYESDEDNSTNDKEKYKFFCDELIKSYVETINFKKFDENKPSLFDILSDKNKFSPEGFSHGLLHFNIMKMCIKLIKKHKIKVSLFFDEPDNYLNPQLIDSLIDLMIEIKDCDIYLSSHNPYFITRLLNSNIDIKIYQTTYNMQKNSENSDKKYYMEIKIPKHKYYIPPSLLIYNVYGVCTIDLLDFLIGKCKENKFDGSSETDRKACENNEKIKKVKEYFKMNVKPDYIENDGGKYKHYSLIHLIRNYYHHPCDQENIIGDMEKKWNGKPNIYKLLKESIENIKTLISKEECDRLFWNHD